MHSHPTPAPAPREADPVHVRGEHLANCPGCDRRQAWLGLLRDRPPCACGYRVPADQLEREQLVIDRLLATA